MLTMNWNTSLGPLSNQPLSSEAGTTSVSLRFPSAAKAQQENSHKLLLATAVPCCCRTEAFPLQLGHETNAQSSLTILPPSHQSGDLNLILRTAPAVCGILGLNGAAVTSQPSAQVHHGAAAQLAGLLLAVSTGWSTYKRHQ